MRKKKEALKYTKFILAYAVIWPIIFACSVEKKYPSGKFHPEYIIPQMLLQWIAKEQKVDGIRYFSTKIVKYPNAPKVNSNFAFPVRKLNKDGYCNHLRKLFELTEPINIQYLLHSGVTQIDVSPNASESIQLTSDQDIKYHYTTFYDVECR